MSDEPDLEYACIFDRTADVCTRRCRTCDESVEHLVTWGKEDWELWHVCTYCDNTMPRRRKAG